MHRYRTHTCEALRLENVGETVRISGWVARKRDHGQLVFLDLRDHFGTTQCVIDTEMALFADVEKTRVESVVTVTGRVVERSKETVNDRLPTGAIEVLIDEFDVQSAADVLPMPVMGDELAGEETRLRYRYLDLRREEMQKKIKLRSQVISSIRRRMTDQTFMEFQTPILTSSSPEGARDFLVPARMHPGKFYALPQAPQQFKQLTMVSGFDRYFQIAPCFRDEDTRANRVYEFYQLDVEMSFVTQDDVFAAMEDVLHGVFTEFSDWDVTPTPFPRIAYADSMLKYGNDKPDLRIPFEICDVTDVFKGSDFAIFARNIEKGAVVRAVPGPKLGSRAICDRMNSWAQGEGAPGMGYIILAEGEGRGPIANKLSPEQLQTLKDRTGMGDGDAIFFACDKPNKAADLAGKARLKIGQDHDMIEKNCFMFCWIVDYPMYEEDETTGKIEFSHNPFSMPQGGLEALETKDPLDVLAHQYDAVVNGVELGSGAIRNHKPEVMIKAFEIAGYPPETVKEKFPALYQAFHYGAPPHGGIATGIDRKIMLLSGEPNIREVILFPMNQRSEDLMMGAPSEVDKPALDDLSIRMAPKIKTE